MATKPTYNKFKQEYCLVCGSSQNLDIAHVLTQKAWPEFKNEEFNCATLCRNCHMRQGAVPIKVFARLYPGYRKWLDEHGWYVCELTGKFRNDKMNIRR